MYVLMVNMGCSGFDKQKNPSLDPRTARGALVGVDGGVDVVGLLKVPGLDGGMDSGDGCVVLAAEVCFFGAGISAEFEAELGLVDVARTGCFVPRRPERVEEVYVV